jgi:adenylate cyclase
LIAAIKYQMHWTISSELQKELASYNISLERLPSFKDIHRSVRSKLSDRTDSKSPNAGTISKLLPGAVAGFITSGTLSFYFRSSDCHGFTPVLNAQVRFDLVDSFDIKKQQKSQRAVRIRLIS